MNYKQQSRRALIADIERMANPPPEPQPSVVYIEPEEEMCALSFVKPIRWR